METLGIDAQLVVASEEDKATCSMLKNNFDIETTQDATSCGLVHGRATVSVLVRGHEQTRVSLTLVA